ncbi:hypothetical protein [Maioricimonas sp. JC845]|uniref:hypothetical protein n=1 Tax=Maioricimonas sp. JC845 TaxID=3232138 RepID=UPI00345B3618
MSITRDEYGIDHGEFKRSRGYNNDFMLDLNEFDSAEAIAAFAVSELCNGSSGDMDKAVIQAALTFAEAELGPGRLSFEEMANHLWQRVPIPNGVALQLFRKWFN